MPGKKGKKLNLNLINTSDFNLMLNLVNTSLILCNEQKLDNQFLSFVAFSITDAIVVN